MLSNKDLEKFRSLTAPEGLKETIEKELSSREKKKKAELKSISAFAACFAVVFSFLIFGYLSDSKPTLMYGGAKISSEAIFINEASEPSVARVAIVSGIPFEIEVKAETTISVSEGGLLKEGKTERTEKIILSEKGKAKVYLVFEDENLPLTLTVSSGKETSVYVFSSDEAKGYVIYKDAETKN